MNFDKFTTFLARRIAKLDETIGRMDRNGVSERDELRTRLQIELNALRSVLEAAEGRES